MKELDRTKDSRIIRQLDRISSIYSGGQRVEIPQGRGQIIFSVAGDTTVVTAEMMNKAVEGRTYLDTEIGISLEELTEMYGTINNGLSLLEHSNEIEDCETAKNIQNISGKIEFKNINFEYNNNLN